MRMLLLALAIIVGGLIPPAIANEPSASIREPDDGAKQYLRAAQWRGVNAEFAFAWDAGTLRISRFTYKGEDLTRYVRIEPAGAGITIVCDAPTINFRIEKLIYNGKFLTGTVRVGEWSTDGKYWPQ